eukprot:3298334-Amphidinium_carterae.1
MESQISRSFVLRSLSLFLVQHERYLKRRYRVDKGDANPSSRTVFWRYVGVCRYLRKVLILQS